MEVVVGVQLTRPLLGIRIGTRQLTLHRLRRMGDRGHREQTIDDVCDGKDRYRHHTSLYSHRHRLPTLTLQTLVVGDNRPLP